MTYNEFPFLKRVNGVHHGVAPLTPEQQKTVESIFNECYREFEAMLKALPDYDSRDGCSHTKGLLMGYRCHVDGVLGRLQGFSDTFSDDPKAHVMDALRDCASADHWYTYEKEW